MGQHSNTAVDVDPSALAHARGVWHGFTLLVKYSLIGIIAVLLLMFVFLT